MMSLSPWSSVKTHPITVVLDQLSSLGIESHRDMDGVSVIGVLHESRTAAACSGVVIDPCLSAGIQGLADAWTASSTIPTNRSKSASTAR